MIDPNYYPKGRKYSSKIATSEYYRENYLPRELSMKVAVEDRRQLRELGKGNHYDERFKLGHAYPGKRPHDKD